MQSASIQLAGWVSFSGDKSTFNLVFIVMHIKRNNEQNGERCAHKSTHLGDAEHVQDISIVVLNQFF